ncbi:MAG: Gfo/Idh/MocA family oxidoreductase [Candidatus Poribacteria bacterium]|nr:Gfo/Idh/MocA family oxidoreductase [Candidatus Poribacteria bacterium]
MGKYRAALLGCGGKGKDHANTLVKDELVNLVALCDVRQEALETFQQAYSVSACYTDYHKMFEREKLDLVVISTQAPHHHAPTLAAAVHGCHVFCEKPMAVTLQEADEMIAACDQAGVRLAINHQKRASAYNDYAKQLIAQGEIGELILIRAYEKGGRKAGNAMMEMGTHLFDWVHNFAGDVSWASAHINIDRRDAAVQDIKHSQEVNPRDRDAGLVIGERAFCAFGFVNGLHADCGFLAESRANDQAYGLDLICTEGRIALRRSVATVMFIHRGEFMTPVEGHQWERVSLPEEDQITGQHLPTIDINRVLQSRIIRSLLEPESTDAEPISSGRKGRAALEMIHGSWESQRRGGRVAFPLKDRTHPLQRWRDEAGLS